MNRYLPDKALSRALLTVAALAFGLGLGKPGIAAGSSSDNGITARVKENLAGVERLKGDDIGVKTVNGVVTLSGTVRDPHAKFAAVQAAISVEGVRVLDDELKTAPVQRKVAMVDSRSGKPMPRHSARDDKITANVQQLLADSLPSRYKVGVVTTNGVVYLSGDLQSRDAIARVSTLVAQVNGVKSVNTVGLDAPFVTMVY